MNICQHEIALSEIVGIGPLMSKRSSDQVARQLYREVQQFFWLHLRAHSILIESEWFSYADHLPSGTRAKEEENHKAFISSYESAKPIVLLVVEKREREAGL